MGLNRQEPARDEETMIARDNLYWLGSSAVRADGQCFDGVQ